MPSTATSVSNRLRRIFRNVSRILLRHSVSSLPNLFSPSESSKSLPNGPTSAADSSWKNKIWLSSERIIRRQKRTSLIIALTLLVVFSFLTVFRLFVFHRHSQNHPNIPVAPTYDTGGAQDLLLSSSSSSLASFSPNVTISIILIVPPFTNAPLYPPTDSTSSVDTSDALLYNSSTLYALLKSLYSATYTPHKPDLKVIVTPHRDHRSHDATFRVIKDALPTWQFGDRYTVTNGTIGSAFERVVFSWTPSPSSSMSVDDNVALIDASRAAPLSPNWYQYAISARAKYAARPDVAALAVRPPPTSVVRFDPSQQQQHEIFFYAGAPYVPVIIPASTATWRAFQRWLVAQRADWFLWPDVSGAKNRTDQAWKGFTGNSRADWTLWFSRFCVLHHLFVVYPWKTSPTPMLLPSQSLTKNNGNNITNLTTIILDEDSNSESILRFDIDGKVEPGSTSSSSLLRSQGNDIAAIDPHSITQIVRLAHAHRGTVSLTLINKAFLETAYSWLCNVDISGIRPPGVVWITTDEESFSALKKIQGSYALLLPGLQGARKETGTSYGSAGYWRLMVERTMLIRDILDRGVAIFAFETDQVWLRDPIPFVTRVARGGDDVDIVGTLDTRHEIAGNFLFLKPTLATRRVWREVTRQFVHEFHARGMHRRRKRRLKYIENDQSILTKLVLFDTEFKARNPVVFRTLDTQLFVDGRWYEHENGKYYTSAVARSPILINNNFLVGIQRKKYRLMKHGHWFYKDGKCDVFKVRRAIMENEARGVKARLMTTSSESASSSSSGDDDTVNQRPRRLEGTDVEAGFSSMLDAIHKELEVAK